jgi:N4-gp56 family major capsid protein
MAGTNFALLTDEEYTVWSRQFWREARNRSFIMAFAGTGPGSMVQRITELSETKDGARAVITLVNEATGDGVVGDNTLKGNEEALRSSEFVIRMDQWRQAHRSSGSMSEQKSIVRFREQARDKLGATKARVDDELAFLTLSGVSYAFKPDGSTRVGSQLPQLEYAADVTAPSSRRHRRWDATQGLVAGDTTAVDVGDTPSWEMLVDMKAYAVNEYMPSLGNEDGIEYYNVFMTPDGIAALKKDPDFLAAWQHAQKQGADNPLFKGTPHGGKRGIYIDGLNILEYRNVFHTTGAAANSKWGATGNVDGQRVLLCGAQALAYADIGNAKWVEDPNEDYQNTLGIAIAKKSGLLKPVHYSTYAQSNQDFAVLCVDTAL